MTSQKSKSSPRFARLHKSLQRKCSSPILPRAARKSSQWSAEDDRNLKALRAAGKSWQEIVESGRIKGKTDNACRKRHERMLLRDKRREVFNNITLKEFSQAYMECRREMWTLLAQLLGVKDWELLEQMAFASGVMTMRNTAKEQRLELKMTETEHQSQVTGIDDLSRLQTPPLTDEEDVKYGQYAEHPSTDNNPNQHASSLPLPSYDQAFRSMYCGLPQSLPVLPNPLAYSTASRDVSHTVQHSHYPQAAPFTLPALEPQGYCEPQPQRPMIQPSEYNVTVRYDAPTTTNPYERGAMTNPTYQHQLTPPTRPEEFVGMKMSVQSMLSEPIHLPNSYNEAQRLLQKY